MVDDFESPELYRAEPSELAAARELEDFCEGWEDQAFALDEDVREPDEEAMKALDPLGFIFTPVYNRAMSLHFKKRKAMARVDEMADLAAIEPPPPPPEPPEPDFVLE